MTVYAKTTWVASTAPGISATALNNLETQYDDAMTQYSTYVPIAASTTPTVGSTTHWARGDHVHNIPNMFWKTTASNTLQMSDGTTTAVTLTASYTNLKGITPPMNLILGSSVRVKVDIQSDAAPYSSDILFFTLGGAATSATVNNVSWATTTYHLAVAFDGTYNTFGTIYIMGHTIGTLNCHLTNLGIYAETTPAFPASSWA
jgi:hypothetical protein